MVTTRARSGQSAKRVGRVRGDERYGLLSMRPLHILAFLLPLIVLYELGSFLYLADQDSGVVETIGAVKIISGFFSAFGVASLYLPGILLAVVLLAWHVILGDRWRVRPSVLVIMLGESVAWMAPLLVLGLVMYSGQTVRPVVGDTGVLGAGLAGGLGSGAASLAWQARLTLAIGAGIYEELLFRLILVSALHLLFVDLMRVKQGAGTGIAAVLSAVLFAAYHDTPFPPGDGRTIVFYSFCGLAGLYFAVLFLLRGFGIVVATHALYDVVAFVLIPSQQGA